MIYILNGGSPDKVYYEQTEPENYKCMEGIPNIREFMKLSIDLNENDIIISVNEQDLDLAHRYPKIKDKLVIPKTKDGKVVSRLFRNKRIQLKSFRDYCYPSFMSVPRLYDNIDEAIENSTKTGIVIRPVDEAGSRGLYIFKDNPLVNSPYIIPTTDRDVIMGIWRTLDAERMVIQEYGPESYTPMNMEAIMWEGQFYSVVTHIKDFHQRNTRWVNGSLYNSHFIGKINKKIEGWLNKIGIYNGMVNVEYHADLENENAFFIECNFRCGSTTVIPLKLGMYDQVKAYKGLLDGNFPMVPEIANPNSKRELEITYKNLEQTVLR